MVAKEMVWCGSRPTGSSWWARRRTPPRLGVWARAGRGAARSVTAMRPPAATAVAPSLRRSRRVGAVELRDLSMEASSLVRAVSSGSSRAATEPFTPGRGAQGRRRSFSGRLLEPMPESPPCSSTWHVGIGPEIADTLGWKAHQCQGGRVTPPVPRTSGPVASVARRWSRFMREMTPRSMPFGQTASHSPWSEHPPKPSWSAAPTMARARRARSG